MQVKLTDEEIEVALINYVAEKTKTPADQITFISDYNISGDLEFTIKVKE